MCSLSSATTVETPLEIGTTDQPHSVASCVDDERGPAMLQKDCKELLDPVCM